MIEWAVLWENRTTGGYQIILEIKLKKSKNSPRPANCHILVAIFREGNNFAHTLL